MGQTIEWVTRPERAASGRLGGRFGNPEKSWSAQHNFTTARSETGNAVIVGSCKIMSLYYDAVALLVLSTDQAGSLKSRVFNSKHLKSPPKQVYALVSEASKWSSVLSEVVEKSQLLQLERKVGPLASSVLCE